MTWLIIAVVVIIVAIALAMVLSKRRSAALQDRFGPEYARTADETDNRRAAEAELRQRQRQHDKLEIQPLSEASRLRYLDEWREIQQHFVDQPSSAVGSANALLTQVMVERGYPMADFDERAELISVEHPEVVENYRIAHQVHESNQQNRASTEDLREALLRYRSLFDELLHSPDQDVPDQQAPTGGTR